VFFVVTGETAARERAHRVQEFTLNPLWSRALSLYYKAKGQYPQYIYSLAFPRTHFCAFGVPITAYTSMSHLLSPSTVRVAATASTPHTGGTPPHDIYHTTLTVDSRVEQDLVQRASAS